MSAEDDAEKSHEPSQRKLDNARKKGEVVRSMDIVVAAVFGGLFVAVATTGSDGVRHFGSVMMMILARSDQISDGLLTGGAHHIFSSLAKATLFSFGTLLALPAAGAALSIIAQRAFVFAASKLEPKLSRISLVSNAKNKFGPSGLFEFLKSFSKLLIFSLCLGVFLYGKFPVIAETIQSEPSVLIILLGQVIMQFILIVAGVMIVFGALDYLWQRHRHFQKNRMSQKEMRDEHKEAEGDPHLKQERRARAQQVSARQVAAEVKGADVVIVNPTHYAVALKWARTPGSAPICVAKGMDELALMIRMVARENGVPVHSDPPTARELFSGVEVGEQIREKHFRAVAVAIQFAEAMRKKVRGFG